MYKFKNGKNQKPERKRKTTVFILTSQPISKRLILTDLQAGDPLWA
jgi:hypothetical protein